MGNKKPFITTTHGISGHFAILVSWYEDAGEEGMWDITQTGIGRHKYKEAAVREGKEWATDEELEFK